MQKINLTIFLLSLFALPAFAQFSERDNPFKGPQYQSDKEYLRVVAHKMGDTNPEILGEIATLNARAKMAEETDLVIDSEVKSVVKSIDDGLKITANTSYEKIIRQKASAVLKGSIIKDTRELYSKKARMYDVWVVVEMKRASMEDFTDEEIEEVRQSLSEEDQRKYSAQLFRELWRKEVKK